MCAMFNNVTLKGYIPTPYCAQKLIPTCTCNHNGHDLDLKNKFELIHPLFVGDMCIKFNKYTYMYITFYLYTM